MILVVNKRYYEGPGEYIGRGGSSLGNPFTHLKTETKAEFKVKSRQEAIDCYEEWLEEKLKTDNNVKTEFDRLVAKYKKTGELVLICWCSPYQNCHGHILSRLIEKTIKDSVPELYNLIVLT